MELIKSFEHPSIPEITINFYADWEDTSDKYVEGSFSEQEDIDLVKRAIANNDMAAWFVARIEAVYLDISCDDYLGGCSYKNFDDFLDRDCYFGDMLHTVTQELKHKLYAIMGSAESIINKIENEEK